MGVVSVRDPNLRRHGIRHDQLVAVQDDHVLTVESVEPHDVALELGLLGDEGITLTVPGVADEVQFNHLGDALGFLERVGVDGQHVVPNGDTGDDRHEQRGDAESSPEERNVFIARPPSSAIGVGTRPNCVAQRAPEGRRREARDRLIPQA